VKAVPDGQRRLTVQSAPCYLFVTKVKVMRQRGRTRLSAKNQATIPVEALRRAGLKPGDELLVQAAGAGRIVLMRSDDPIARHAGALTGVYPKGYLRQLRREWR
jgi:bifunctional DNA-binding transcriptional regulator/antitoxin component of YhaV-PrlF toxin-antitoxin module